MGEELDSITFTRQSDGGVHISAKYGRAGHVTWAVKYDAAALQLQEWFAQTTPTTPKESAE